MSGTGFQVELSGDWTSCSAEEDKILRRAYLSGFPHARYSVRGQKYETDFQNMKQTNLSTGKERQIRPPHELKAPSAPITKPGPATCITVPPGSPGTTIQVPNPEDKQTVIAVDVPATARVGQAMLVPHWERAPNPPTSRIEGPVSTHHKAWPRHLHHSAAWFASTTIQVPNPEDKQTVIAVDVPATARVGQAMLVPIPKAAKAAAADAADAAAAAGTVAVAAGRAVKAITSAAVTAAKSKVKGDSVPVAHTDEKEKKKWSTGATVAAQAGGAVAVGGVAAGRAVKAIASAAVTAAKSKVKGDSVPVAHTDEKEKKKWSTGATVAAQAGGAVAVGGLAVGGFLLAEHVAEEGWDATMDDVGDAATAAGEGIAEGAEAAVEWVGDAADAAGDFIKICFSKVKGDSVPVAHTDEKEKKKWSTGATVAAQAGGAVAVGGLAVGGFLLAEHVAEEGWDATMDDVGDAATAAGEGIAEGAEAAVEWVGDAADAAGDFIIDLF
eukprot:CAMPEP_0172779376 /NCGR_PEP_ID=MMETSP1074-20121228/202385_1 /TAXON_ID=2916 /ORGANISM="Ceratium fusus, Strain PA161109" /LENGTH=496 /DNA_ID=CAMNT_0013616335 /DNA_START=45 /DNA_END=1538 /DNA_ORIENTATION=+